jgi:methylmalonyl-CoA/ethylmalonyl-CoA epimerase
MKIIGIDHIAIAVNNIKVTAEYFNRAFGIGLSGTEKIPDRFLEIGMLDLNNTKVELVEGKSPETTIAKYIAKKGEGIHHICVQVDNIDEVLAHLKSRGFNLIDEKPRSGAEGARIAFVHPSSFGGILIELKEKN